METGRSQHPAQTAIELRIDTLEVVDSNFLLQDDLVETDDEVRIQESAMEDRQSHDPTDESEIGKMFRVDTRCWIDLKRVVVDCRVFEKAVEGIKHLV